MIKSLSDLGGAVGIPGTEGVRLGEARGAAHLGDGFFRWESGRYLGDMWMIAIPCVKRASHSLSAWW